MRLYSDPGDWVTNRSLGDLRLRDEGVAVLGIARADGSYVGDVTVSGILRIGDTAIVYGRTHELE